jgi:hypothetical protein
LGGEVMLEKAIERVLGKRARKAVNERERDAKRLERQLKLLRRTRRDGLAPSQFKEAPLPPHDFADVPLVLNARGWRPRRSSGRVHLTEAVAAKVGGAACRRCLLEKAVKIGRAG